MKISVSETWKIGEDLYRCPECRREFTKRAIAAHMWRAHGDGTNHDSNSGYALGTRNAWNKGETKYTSESVRKSGETYRRRVTSGEIILTKHFLNESTRKKISDSMKRAHSEGRAWNIGKSRWNNQPSYPEKFFSEVISNEFQNVEYVREYPFDRYALDFAWPALKRCIEIDGEQHQRFETYRVRDAEKDAALELAGWKVLRIMWKDLYRDTKTWIKIAKDFIDC